MRNRRFSPSKATGLDRLSNPKRWTGPPISPEALDWTACINWADTSLGGYPRSIRGTPAKISVVRAKVIRTFRG